MARNEPVPSSEPLAIVAVRLLSLVLGVVLLTSRVMLVLHELGGRQAVATLFGGRITGWFLFLFAGGRVSWEAPDLPVGARLAIALGGIMLELVLGGVAFLVARRLSRRPVARFSVLAVGTVLVGHGAIYLARGVHYGFGDGALLARVLGDARWPIVAVATALAVATAFLGGRRLAVLPASLISGPASRSVALALGVFVTAGLAHGGLALAEIRWFPDSRWAAIMEEASAVQARAELRRRVADAARRGEAPPPPADQQRILAELERARRPWPLDPVLGGLVVVALVGGVVAGARETKAKEATGRPPSWRTLGLLALALALAVTGIAVLRSFG